MTATVGGGPLDRRVIEPQEFVADTAAFVDVRLAQSQGKASYSFIGPGVSQNADQVINLNEPHGFNVGAAAMPHGVVNNPHLHFTAEVFLCTRGSFRLTIGEDGEQVIDIEAGTVFSAPTWVFRGFTNTGPDDGWLFVVLGGDDTGGIIWAPKVLEEAAKTGLYLDPTNAVLDATAGDDVSGAIPPADRDLLDQHIARYSDEELAARSVAQSDLQWSDRALLSAVLPGHRGAMAPIIGNGLTQDRTHRSPITDPHGFSMEWLELQPGASTGRHRHGRSQAMFLVSGAVDLVLEIDGASESSRPAEGSVISIPPDQWRDITNRGTEPARLVVVCGSDGRAPIEWSPEVVQAARDAGWAVDASGYLAPAPLIRNGATP